MTRKVKYGTIERFPGYRFGSDGSCWTRWRCIGTRAAVWLLDDEWRRMRPLSHGNGYLKVCLPLPGDDQKKWRRHYIHALVIEAFRGPRPPGMETRHLDGDRGNNVITNLAYGTRAENRADSVRHGTAQRGSRNGHAKISEADIAEMLWLREEYGMTQDELARMFGLDQGQVSRILGGEAWRHATGIQPRPRYVQKETFW
jgi:hypothetical protein